MDQEKHMYYIEHSYMDTSDLDPQTREGGGGGRVYRVILRVYRNN